MLEEFKCENGHFFINDNVMYMVLDENISLGDLIWNNDGDVFEVGEDDDLVYINEYYLKVKKL